ncbi:MAG TPA: short-chain dehydrogenase [Verrucomicrobia subdivision 3 bacterium]|nr:short-chain dehydrogenase [Limisphaerales bacterium]
MKETVLVTGASSGIGLELARCFAADKSNLVLVARNTAALEKLAAELRREHQIEVHVLTADLARPESAREIFEQAGRGGITVDVLVNNAGFGLHGAFTELPLPRQLEIIQVNVTALVELTGLFLPGMLRRKRGGILNVGSVAGFLPGPNMAIYYATKAFVQSFTEALDEELRGSGVAVSVLCPGPTETNFSQTARGYHTREMKAAKMPAAEVASAGHRAFRAGRCVNVPGAKNILLVQLIKILPRSIIRKAIGRYNKLK